MLQSEQYKRKSIIELLMKNNIPDSAAIAAAEHAMEYARNNRNADFSVLLDKARFYAKHNKAASAPTIKREIQRARLPKWHVGR